MTINNLFKIIYWLIAFCDLLSIKFISESLKKYFKEKNKKYLVHSGLYFLLTLFIFFSLIVIPYYFNKPQIKISIEPTNDPCLSLSEYPQHEYRFMIENSNKNSSSVSNFYIEFFFPNIVVDSSIEENIDTGGPVRMFGIQECKRNGDGKIIHLFPKKKKELSYAKIEPLREGSNIAIFKCDDSWPTDNVLYGTITIDLEKKPIFTERPYDIGKFRAIYSYNIDYFFNFFDYPKNKLIGMIPEADFSQTKAEKYFQDGLEYLKHNEFKNAIMNFNDCIKISPNHEYAYKQRGYAYGITGNYKLAIEDFSHYIELAPKENLGYYNRAVAKKNLNDNDGAKIDFYKSYQLGNDNALKEYLILSLPEINPIDGYMELNISKENWLKNNNDIITIIPEVEKKDFKIHAFKDKDNIFKVRISNKFSENAELKFEDFDWLINKAINPNHTIKITWFNNENKLYIDNALIDINPISLDLTTKNKKSESSLFDSFKSINPLQGEIKMSFSNPILFQKTDSIIQIFPHLYRNGVELSVYKDIDNSLKVLMTNQFGNSFIMKYSNLNDLINWPGHPNHLLMIKWENGITNLYLDSKLVDSYEKVSKTSINNQIPQNH